MWHVNGYKAVCVCVGRIKARPCPAEVCVKRTVVIFNCDDLPMSHTLAILAEGAIALSVTHSGGALFAS